MTQAEKIKSPAAITQYFAVISVNLIMVAFGCATGWLSMALPLLKSDATPMETGKLTRSELSWIASVMPLGALIGSCFCGFIVTIVGTRNMIYYIGIPQLISWQFLIFGTCPLHLAISRALSGFVVGGAQMCLFLYVVEIADNEIRGQLGTVVMYARNIGILFAFTLGSYYTYMTSAIFFTGITIMFLMIAWFVPSTPQYFLHKNNVKAAQESFNFYNRHRLQTEEKYCLNHFENLKLNAQEDETKSKLTWNDFVSARYGFLQAIVFPMLNSLTAQSVFLTYGSTIMAKSGTRLPTSGSSIFMAVVQLIAAFITYKLIDRKGRKFLLILSLVGCAISHAIMVAYMQVNHYEAESGFRTSMAFYSIPIFCMASVIFTSSIGILPLTFICMSESFPTRIRPLGMTFGSIVLNLFGFIVFKMYPWLEHAVGLQVCLMIFCAGCALGTVYVVAVVEETKGKELNE